MALINCRECDHEVSTEATACPNCGAPPQRRKSNKGNISCIHAILIILVPIVGLLMGLFMLTDPDEKENAPAAILFSLVMIMAYTFFFFIF